MPNYTLKLNNGKKMLLVGRGLLEKPNKKTTDHVCTAIKAGYRLFDGTLVSRIPIAETGDADLV
jgi:diketogulonate reductase-like aldo/keto reductase